MTRARLWTSDFAVSFATLALLKLALLAENVRVSEGFQAPRDLLSNPHLVLGHDAVGAALLATLLGLVLSPARRERPFGRGVVMALQAVHALFAVASAWSLLLLGGWINRTGIQATVHQTETGTDALLASLWSYLTLPVLFSLFMLPAVAVLLGQVVPRRLAAARPRAPALVLSVGVAACLATWLWLPLRVNGTSGRLYTNNLERSPVPELLSSYARPLLRRSTGRTPTGRAVNLHSLVRPGERFDSPLVRATRQKSHLLVVLLESIGAAYVEREPSPMPRLQALSRRTDAVTFESHYTTWSLTTKSVFSLLASELPYPEALPETYVNPRVPCATLGQALHDAGYYTAFVSSQDFSWERQMAFLRGRGFDVLWDKHSLPGREGAWSAPWGVDDRVTIQAVLGLLREHREQPFFGLVQLVAGHHPYVTDASHDGYGTLGREGSYLRAIRVADDRLGDLLQGLEREGLADSTLVLVLSDHGESHVSGQGRNLYEVVARVPAVLFGPQTRGAGGVLRRTTSHIDVAPTLLGLLGLPVPCSMKGRDLTRSAPERLSLLGGRPPAFQLGAVDGPWKYVLENDEREDLFELSGAGERTVDPGGANRVIFEALRARVAEYRDASRELLEEYRVHLAASGCAAGPPKADAPLAR